MVPIFDPVRAAFQADIPTVELPGVGGARERDDRDRADEQRFRVHLTPLLLAALWPGRMVAGGTSCLGFLFDCGDAI